MTADPSMNAIPYIISTAIVFGFLAFIAGLFL